MRNISHILAFTVLLISSSAFADVAGSSSSTALAFSEFDSVSFKPCENIVNACLNAGYTRADNAGKTFWGDCMKPILLGKSVVGTHADAKDVAACREFKIKKLQAELQDLQQVK
jgi:hypothetical protein